MDLVDDSPKKKKLDFQAVLISVITRCAIDFKLLFNFFFSFT